MLTQYPEVVSLYRVEDQYMLSDTILVAPVIESQVTKRTVHFPTKDIWYDTNTAKLVPLTLNSSESESVTFDVNMETIPWFIRGGSIIPEKLIPKKASIHMKDDPISFLVALDKDGNAKGTLFLDDEMSFAYLQGHYNYYSLHFHENKFHIEMIDHTEKYTTMNKYGMIMIFGYNGRPTEVKAVFEDERRNDEILDFTVEDTAIMIDASQLNIADKMYIQLTSGSMYIFANGLLITLVIVMLNIFK
jgi:mannosyl-oligosaccharide alpha-1,3-glucosidase